MRKLTAISALVFCVAFAASAQSQPSSASASPANAAPQANSASQQTAQIDGIAARIGNDVLTDSEVRQLADYQKLVEGKAQDRTKVVGELVDQWVVETDALASKFPHPTAADVSLEFQALLKQFPSREQFQARLVQIGLTQDQVRQVIERQLYYIRFLNYKFLAATQVTSAQIQSYYQQDLVPQFQKRGVSVPPMSQVETQIRQLLTQEEINEKAAQWLEEAKARLRIVIQPLGGGG
ncbi:MAG TPA: hypothetical protein VKB26_06200 [Candidatus Acidoferrales bacterium]|nr:hypothetical protein [Candidatus Acidoferrales bacterium]